VEAAIFRNTDVVADAHALPFMDAAFDAVVVMNAFEHYRDPPLAAREIFRVLRPGGTLLVRTAFLQPLHEAPWHFYNCTKYGLLEWFKAFEPSRVVVSDNFTPSYAVAWLLSEAEAALRQDVSAAAADDFLSAPISRFVAFWRDEATRADPLWADFAKLPQATQEGMAAGFEYVGTKPR
jgi:SAM-dependent methyltransferase